MNGKWWSPSPYTWFCHWKNAANALKYRKYVWDLLIVSTIEYKSSFKVIIEAPTNITIDKEQLRWNCASMVNWIAGLLMESFDKSMELGLIEAYSFSIMAYFSFYARWVFHLCIMGFSLPPIILPLDLVVYTVHCTFTDTHTHTPTTQSHLQIIFAIRFFASSHFILNTHSFTLAL